MPLSTARIPCTRTTSDKTKRKAGEINRRPPSPPSRVLHHSPYILSLLYSAISYLLLNNVLGYQ